MIAMMAPNSDASQLPHMFQRLCEHFSQLAASTSLRFDPTIPSNLLRPPDLLPIRRAYLNDDKRPTMILDISPHPTQTSRHFRLATSGLQEPFALTILQGTDLVVLEHTFWERRSVKEEVDELEVLFRRARLST